jgi:hypothetical protein
MTGKERVQRLLKGESLDRVPLFDSIRNDAILEHFAGEKVTYGNARHLTRFVHTRAVDSTRMLPKLPVAPIDDILPDGRKAHYERWMRWVEHQEYSTEEEYIETKKRELDKPLFTEEEKAEVDATIQAYAECEREYLKDTFFFWAFGVHDRHQFGVECRSFLGYYLTDLYEEIGITNFSLWLFGNTGLLDELLERAFTKSLLVVEWIYKSGFKPDGLFIADDMAFRNGPLVSPKFLEKSYFPRFKKVVDAIKAQGIPVMFHTDGHLEMLIDDLAGTGIDILNPLEKIPGFCIKEIHQRCPHLVLSGGIDVGHVLPLGTPDEVKAEVHRAIEDSEGKIMIGASSIVTDNIPLENYLAMREAVGVFDNVSG